ncbi:hypothetical protein MLD38_003633 [Melastoma candidum]|uniref:Uncharacterized protein n=1 Tax=Melastoma candidum TaxID=119954 RepID=A0ACB9S2W9_9MYRT|nr:hypothetical protein MLD38_003633 [Melastoma candidum]
MECSSPLRSLYYCVGTVSSPRFVPFRVSLSRRSSAVRGAKAVVSCGKTAEGAAAAAAALSKDGGIPQPKEKISSPLSTFPSGFEGLLLEVCDETEIAELKVKVGDFEMHVKRNIGAVPSAHSAVVSPVAAPPIPSEPMEKSGPPAPLPPTSSPAKPSAEKTSPFANVTFGKSKKLNALEASGASGYVLVASPTVGSFRRGRTVKGKRQPPSYKEGDLIKEGQVIGWLDQFGTELPVKSDVAGEVLKLLVDDGEGVGYGDPLIAVLPSFHGIK